MAEVTEFGSQAENDYTSIAHDLRILADKFEAGKIQDIVLLYSCTDDPNTVAKVFHTKDIWRLAGITAQASHELSSVIS